MSIDRSAPNSSTVSPKFRRSNRQGNVLRFFSPSNFIFKDQGIHAYSIGSAITDYATKAPQFNTIIIISLVSFPFNSYL